MQNLTFAGLAGSILFISILTHSFQLTSLLNREMCFLCAFGKQSRQVSWAAPAPSGYSCQAFMTQRFRGACCQSRATRALFRSFRFVSQVLVFAEAPEAGEAQGGALVSGVSDLQGSFLFIHSHLDCLFPPLLAFMERAQGGSWF